MNKKARGITPRAFPCPNGTPLLHWQAWSPAPRRTHTPVDTAWFPQRGQLFLHLFFLPGFVHRLNATSIACSLSLTKPHHSIIV